jgi:hypothetical protein
VAGSCEHGNEPSGSITSGEYLDQLSVLLASQERFCCMELVCKYHVKLKKQVLLRIIGSEIYDCY